MNSNFNTRNNFRLSQNSVEAHRRTKNSGESGHEMKRKEILRNELWGEGWLYDEGR